MVRSAAVFFFFFFFIQTEVNCTTARVPKLIANVSVTVWKHGKYVSMFRASIIG